MSTRTQAKTPAPAVADGRTFNTEEQQALIKKQVKAFFAHTNNDAVLRELQTVMISGRTEVGWKQLGRTFVEQFKEHAFES